MKCMLLLRDEGFNSAQVPSEQQKSSVGVTLILVILQPSCGLSGVLPKNEPGLGSLNTMSPDPSGQLI